MGPKDRSGSRPRAARGFRPRDGIWRFGPFRLDAGRMELFCGAERMALRPTPARLLAYLVEHRGRVVPQRELLDAVWGDAVVDASALRTALKEVRRALGESGALSSTVETRRGRGVVFTARVEAGEDRPDGPPGPTPALPPDAPVAKLAPPEVAGVVARPRLFERLDAAGPAVWLTGPAGSGKTALLASYLASRTAPSAWIQLDARDGDPASFFFYAARLGERRGAPLPPFAADGAAGLAAFTRTFFEGLFAAAGRGFTLVLDDLHEVPPDAPWWRALPALLAVVPPGCRLLLASRETPPASLARSTAHRRLEHLGGPQLAPTREEVAAIVRERTGAAPSEPDVAALAERCAGWMGGLVLCLETREGAEAGAAPRERLVFDYLASEVLERASREEREVLLAAAATSNPTPALVNELTGMPGGETVLADWSARGRFVARHAGRENSYRLHPLLRELLRARAAERFSRGEWRRRLTRAGDHLAGAGAADEAAELFREAEAWPRLDALLREHAPALQRSGRHRTLREWVREVPDEALDAHPWLRLWRGASGVAVEAPAARPELETAFAAFEQAGERTGAGLALTEIFEAIWREFGSYRRVDAWVPALERLLEEADALPALPRIRLEGAAFRALGIRFAEHPLLDVLRHRLERISRGEDRADAAAIACVSLFHFRAWRQGPAAAAVYLRRLEDLDLADPLLRVEVETERAILAWNAHRGRDAVTIATAAAELAEQHGALQLANHALAQAVYGWLACGQPSAALAAMHRLQSLRSDRPALFEDCHRRYLHAWIAAASGDLGEARRRIRNARRLAERNGAPFPEAHCVLLEASIAHGQGDRRATREALARGLSVARAMPSEQLLYLAGWVEADLAFESVDRGAARRVLRETLARGRRRRLLFAGGQHAPLVRRGCERALEEGIETGFARTLLRLDGARDDALRG